MPSKKYFVGHCDQEEEQAAKGSVPRDTIWQGWVGVWERHLTVFTIEVYSPRESPSITECKFVWLLFK